MAGRSKRASMREGPLAALFRKTEEDGLGEPIAPAPANGAASNRSAAKQPARRKRGAAVKVETTAQERLREAFNSELPIDILDCRVPAAPAQALDVYARSAASDAAMVPRPLGQPRLRVVGVGGAGVNAVNRMIEAEITGVEFIAVNTDLQSLQQSTAGTTLHIGAQVTRGLGSGANAAVGREAAIEAYDDIKALLKGTDMVFIAAGAGGGTGTGAAPIVARIARELGALTVGIVTKPFGFEGTRRAHQADVGIAELAAEVDTLIVVPNNRLLAVLDKKTTMVDAFQVADDVLRQGVQGIADLVTLPGLINLDFADVRTVMSGAGNALLGIGMGVGDDRAVEAAMTAVASPLLETSMEGARQILLSITGGPELGLWEVNEAARAVSEAAHPDANIIFGAMVDEKLTDQVWVTVVATGYGERTRFRRPIGAAQPQQDLPAPPIEEPTGEEPRIQRVTPAREPSLGALAIADIEVPEFVPRRPAATRY
jgi:cell division protein FtsZ